MYASYCRCPLLIMLAPVLLLAEERSNSSLTVLMDFEAPHSTVSLQTLRSSLSRLLSPVGLAVDVQLKSEISSGAQFGELVIFKMKGSCSVSSQYSGPLYDERGPLALAYTSDGTVLHFGEVECDRVRTSLQRIIGHNASLKNQRAYGSALAMVIAHEVYHMLANVKNHTGKGLTKAELSAAELMDDASSLPLVARQAIGSGIHPELAVH